VPNGYEMILESAGFFSLGATQFVAVYRQNDNVYVQNTGDEEVVLVRPDRPQERIPIRQGQPEVPDAPHGSVIQIGGDKRTLRILHTTE
jgi:hypothetical protein